MPLRLKDKAAKKKQLIGQCLIDHKSYRKVKEVTFEEKGGGTDFDDIFYYLFRQGRLQPRLLRLQIQQHQRRRHTV